MNPHVSSQFTGNGARVLHALEAETGRAFPLRRLRGAAARPLRRRARGPDADVARAGDPVPGGRRGARHDRRAAHVRRRRRRGQGRRLHHLGGRRRRATSARSASCASRRPGARRPPRCSSRASRCRPTAGAPSPPKPAAKASEEKPAPKKRVRTTRPKPTPKTEAEAEDEPAADGEKAPRTAMT